MIFHLKKNCLKNFSGLDFHRPVVYEHSKRLLGNLIVLLACREDYAAACEARLTQYDVPELILPWVLEWAGRYQA